MILDAIINHKKEEVSNRKKRAPLEEIKRGLTCSARSLKEGLKQNRTGFILELKRASPSRGTIRQDFTPAALAKIYEPYADGISVLADEKYFGGRLEYIQDVAETVNTPVMLKDFVVDPYQIYEARKYGANGILLMLSVLSNRDFSICMEATRLLGMDALVEVHDREELDRALDLGAEIIGINNRNLKDLSVDLKTTEELAPLVPKDKILIAESGIRDHRDIVRLRKLVSGFLVGSSLMSRLDLDRACRELIYGPVKVCGLKSEDDATWAKKKGALYGGLIFAKESPRRVSVETAKRLVGSVSLDWAGVFLNEDLHEVARVTRDLDLKVVQLHGDEDDDYVKELRKSILEYSEIWKALRIKDEAPRIQTPNANRILLDTYRPFARGGTGKKFDWSLIEGLDKAKIVLSGGLGVHNVEEADRLGVGALDVNSGLETEPGLKDHGLVARFFEKLRGEGRR